MAEIVGLAEAFAGALADVAPVLDERARRLLMGRGSAAAGAGWDHADRRCDGRRLDTNTYQKGVRITDKVIDRLRDRPHLQRHKFHGNWNYTVTGTPAANTTRPEGQEKFISEP